MDVFKGIRNVIAPVSTENLTVDQIVSRLQQSKLPEARHNACEQISKLAKTHQLELGVRSIPVLTELIRDNRSDLDFLALLFSALDSLVMNYSESNGGVVNSEALLQDVGMIEMIIDVLDEGDMYVRLSSVRLLGHLAENKLQEVQESIIRVPTGLAKLVDVLSDKREVICNEGLYCISTLSHSNKELCKILVFEGVLEILLDIVAREGGVSGGYVVQQCLELVCSLIEEPFSQNYFRETSCYQRLPTLLKVPDAVALATTAPGPLGDGTQLGKQIAVNLSLSLKMVELMVSDKSDNLSLNQSAMFKSGAFSMVGDLALGPQKAPRTPSIRAQALKTMGSLIRLNQSLQDALAGATVPKDDGTHGVQGALSRVLRLAIYSREPHVGPAALICFTSYLYNNPDSQLAVASTVLPVDTNEVVSSEQSAGQVLTQALLQWEALGMEPDQVYRTCTILCNVIEGNTKARDMLLNTPLELGGEGNSTGDFLTKLAKSWIQCSRAGCHVQIRIGLLRVLSYLLHDSTTATSSFLSHSSYLPYLVDQVSFKNGSTITALQGHAALLLGVCLCNIGTNNSDLDGPGLLEVIRQRIGVDGLTAALDTVRDSPEFLAGKNRWEMTGSEEIGYSGGIAEFFNQLYDLIQRRILALYTQPKRTEEENNTDSRDEELRQLQQQVFDLRKKVSDQSAQLSAQFLKSSEQSSDSEYMVKQAVKEKNAEIEVYKNKITSLNEWLSKKDDVISDLKKSLRNSLSMDEVDRLREELSRAESEVRVLSDAYNDAETLLHQREAEVKSLKEEISETNELRERVKSLEKQLEEMQAEQNELLLCLAEVTDGPQTDTESDQD